MTKLTKFLTIIGIPLIFALALRLIFGVKALQPFYSIMTITFLCSLPSGVGAWTIYLSDMDRVKKFSYRFFMPWVPILDKQFINGY